jgi:hypothetical protein
LAAVACISTAFLVSPAIAAETTQVPDLSGDWARNALRLEPPVSGTGPVARIRRPRTSGSGTQLVFDHTSPLLTPQGAMLLKQRTDGLVDGQIFPTLHDQCLPEPPVLALAIQAEVRILQQKDRVTFVYLAGPSMRFIRLNSQHPAKVTPSWTGDSIGHYEGDTLVVDTVGIKASPMSMIDWLGPQHSPALHVVERYRLIDGETAKQAMAAYQPENFAPPDLFYGVTVDPDYKGRGLQVEITVDDPNIFTMSWSAKVTYARPLGEFTEAICAENPLPSYWGKDTAIPVAQKPDF